jgi:hypothetical protein
MVTTHRPFGDREESVTLTFSPTCPDALYENMHEYGFSLTFTRTLTPGSLACRFFYSFRPIAVPKFFVSPGGSPVICSMLT